MIAIFPEIAGAAAQLQIDRASFLVRKYFGGDQAFKPKLDVAQLSEAIGIQVTMAPMEDFGALAVKDVGGRFTATIVVNPSVVEETELAFLIGHLLGHFYLHVQPYIARGEWQNTGFKEPFCPLKRFLQDNYSVVDQKARLHEEQADMFAASLILPKVMVSRAASRLKSVDALGDFFGVTPIFLTRWMEVCGLQPEKAPQSFHAAESMMEDPGNLKKSNSSEPGLVGKAPVSRSVGYHRKAVPEYEPKQTSPQSSGKTPGNNEVSGSPSAKAHPLEQSLKMFRDLASRLDQSVKSET